MKRAVADSDGTKLWQVLYVGKQEEIFFFYDRNSEYDEDDIDYSDNTLILA